MLEKHISTRGRCAPGVFFVLLCVVLLSACATRPVVPPADRAAEWRQHRQVLAQLNHWAFSGRVAVRDTQQESWSAGLDWQQRNDSFDISLSGAFGRRAARLSGQPGYAVIETRDRAALSATSAEALMREQLGWSVPVAGFKYWLIGVPAPGVIERYALDEAGRLAELEQSGWQIRYRSYQDVDGLALPRKLELENSRLRVRLVIGDWQLSDKESVDGV